MLTSIISEYTYAYIQTHIHKYINICIKGQNSLMVWRLDTKGTQGLCQGRAVSCLLGWGSGGHQWGADQGAGQVTHPTELSFWHCCRKPPIALLCPEIICEIPVLALYNVSGHCKMAEYRWMRSLPPHELLTHGMLFWFPFYLHKLSN